MIRNKEDTGVANPYALAEALSGRRIPWKEISKKTEILEEIFKMRYDEIIHPDSGSPIFYAFEKTWGLDIREMPTQVKLTKGDFAKQNEISKLTDVSYLGDLARVFPGRKLSEFPIKEILFLDGNRIQVEFQIPKSSSPSSKDKSFTNRNLTKEFLRESLNIYETKDVDWQPPGGSWVSSGDFFQETAEFHDPIQGIVGDCYLIAALSSVAWARPFDIVHRTRATGTDQPNFINMVEFHEEYGQVVQVEVTGTIPVSDASGYPFFARSSEPGEYWPAILEKAYAKWKTGHQGDAPDIMKLAGGSPFKAIEHLTGLEEWHESTSAFSGDELWQIVRSNSMSRRTFLPMAAATTSEFLINETGGTYVGSGIVPGHAYSILGWDYYDGEMYIILRNPWGYQEPDVGILSGAVSFFDISWWRNIDLSAVDGVFGLNIDQFKEYFYYIGGGAET